VTLYANGVDLSNLAFNVASLSGRWTTPQRRGKDIDVSGRHGTIRTTGKKFTAGTVVLPMWVVGANEDGSIPHNVTSQEVVHDNIDRLTRLFSADTVKLVHVLPDGSSRQIVGQVIDAIDFSSMAGATRAEFGVTLTTAGAFWEDTDVVTATRTGTGVWDVLPFAGATAPMDDLIVKFTGPATNPRVTNPSGVYASYGAVLTGSQSISINCATWALVGTGITPSYSALDHGGDPRWFVMEPGVPVPKVTASQTAGSTGVFSLSGRRKYMVG
jgi:hypothetical protein